MSPADPTRLKLARQISISGIALCVARHPVTGRVYFGNADYKVYELDPAAEKPQAVAFEGDGHQSYVTGVVVSGEAVISGAYDGRLMWWNTASRKLERTIDGHERWIRRLAVSPDGKTLASIADDMRTKLWDAATGQLRHTLEDHQPMTPHDFPSMLYAVAFSPDGRLLATGDKVGHIVIREVATGKLVGTLEAPVMYTWDPRARRHSIGGIRALCFSADASLLAVGGMGKVGNIDHLEGNSRLEVFDWQKAERKFEAEDNKFKGLIEDLAFDPAGRWIVTAGGDNGGFVTFYDLSTGKIIQQEKGPTHIHQFAMGAPGTSLMAAGQGRLMEFAFAAPEPVAPPPLPEARA